MAIYHQSGTHVGGPNTKFGQIHIPAVQGTGVISYCIPSLSLLEGGYTLSVAVVNHNDTETYDYQDRMHNFQVYRGRSKEQYGLVTLNGTWKSEPGDLVPAPAHSNKITLSDPIY